MDERPQAILSSNSFDCLQQDDGWNSYIFTEDAIAKQFYSLSFPDRNAIAEEIHGVRSMACEETPEMIENSLRLLAMELQKLPSDYRRIYQKACSMPCKSKIRRSGNNRNITVQNFGDFKQGASACDQQQAFYDSTISSIPSSDCYAKSRDFHLAFLRCESFDAKKAAIRLAKYLDLAHSLYGEEALQRPLRIEDFKTKEEIELLNAGYQQLLPFRDRSGRRVLFIHGDLSLPRSSLLARSILSKGPAMKLLLYMWSVLLEDVDAQRRGLVVVWWPQYMNNHGTQDKSDEEGSSPYDSIRRKRRTSKLQSNQNTDAADDENNLVLESPDNDSKLLGKHFFEAVPVRACAFHCCSPDTPVFRMIRHVFLLILDDTYRSRVKTHQGE